MTLSIAPAAAPGPAHFGRLVGDTAVMRALFAQLERVSQADGDVLLMGESGTGKELIARALHAASECHDGPFVVVDCGALAPSLIASELFGHERGAFTGAETRQAGAFESAHGGTLLLDEVGELPLTLQKSLLGVLERRIFRRVGGHREVAVDVRVIAATNRDLSDDVAHGKFRLDLFYRLAVLTVRTPALRDHADDIPLLIDAILAECESPLSANDLFSDARLQALRRRPWNGNVRELRNLVLTTLALGREPRLSSRPPPDDAASPTPAPLLPYAEAKAEVLRDFERRYLTRLLEETDGNVSEAARRAKMDRSYLTQLLRRHQLR